LWHTQGQEISKRTKRPSQVLYCKFFWLQKIIVLMLLCEDAYFLILIIYELAHQALWLSIPVGSSAEMRKKF
jgi:hypothetical protein